MLCRFTLYSPEKNVLEVVGPPSMQSLKGIADAVEKHAPEVSNLVHNRTIQNVVVRFIEQRGMRAVVVKVAAHNTSSFEEANEGELGTLHTKKICLQQELEGDCPEARRAALLSDLKEINLQYDNISRAHEHYKLVHFHIAAYISQWSGLSQVTGEIKKESFFWTI